MEGKISAPPPTETAASAFAMTSAPEGAQTASSSSIILGQDEINRHLQETEKQNASSLQDEGSNTEIAADVIPPTAATNAQEAGGATKDIDSEADNKDSSEGDNPITETKIKLYEAGKRIINAENADTEGKLGQMSEKQQKEWLTQNRGKNDLLTFNLLMNGDFMGQLKKQKAPIDLTYNGQGEPIKITTANAEGTATVELIITGITRSTTDTLKCATTSGEEVDLSREMVASAYLAARKENIQKVVADPTKNTTLMTYIDSAGAAVRGEKSPIDSLSTEDLTKLNNTIENSETNKSSDDIERPDPIEKWTAENVRDQIAVFRHEFDVKDDKKGLKELKQELDDALKDAAAKANKQVKNLTPEEVSAAERTVVRRRIDKAIDAHAANLPTQHRALVEDMIRNWIAAHPGQTPSEQQVAQMKRNLSKEYVTAVKLEKLNDPKYMEEIRRKFGWKDLAGLILFLTKDIGENFAPNMQQHR